MQTEFSPQFEMLLQLLDHPDYRAGASALQGRAAELEGNWDSFEQLLHRHRVTRRAVSELATAGIGVPAGLRQKAFANAVVAMEQVVEAHRVQTTLGAHGIRSLVLKGAVLSQTLYADPTLRESKDIDLLVERQHFETALSLLTSECGHTCLTNPPLGTDRYALWLDGNKDLSLASEHGIQLELHHRLTAAENLLPSLGLAQAVNTIAIGSKSFAQFDRPSLFVYLCVHGAASRWHRLTWLTDIRHILATSTEADAIAYCDKASMHGVERCALSAMILCQRLWGQHLPSVVSERAGADPRVTRIVKNCITTITDEDYLPSSARGRAYVSNALILRDGWRYRYSVIKEILIERDLISNVPIPYRLRFLYIPLRALLWLKRKISKMI